MLEEMGQAGEAHFWRWGHLIIVEYRGLTTVEELKYLAKIERGTIAKHGRFATLNVIRYATLAVPEDVRTYANEMATEFKSTSIAYAILVPGRSLGAATFRSVLAGISLVARSSVPQSTFKYPAEALDWLADQGGISVADVQPIAEALQGTVDCPMDWGALAVGGPRRAAP